jgi:hypothetical protein
MSKILCCDSPFQVLFPVRGGSGVTTIKLGVWVLARVS